MKIFAVALMMICVAGCASYTKVQQRTPAYSAITRKTPQVFAQCAVLAFMDENPSTHIISDGSSRIVVVPVPGGFGSTVSVTLEATSRDSGALVQMRHMPSFSDFHRQWNRAKKCL